MAPGPATVLLGSLCYLAFVNLPDLLGLSGPLVPAAYGVVVLLGVLHGVAVRAAAPITYAGIGLGGTAVAPVPPAVPRQRTPGAHRPERVRR